MSNTRKRNKLKDQLETTRQENTELRRLLRRVFPQPHTETGRRKASPDRLWKLVRQLSHYTRWLNEMTGPQQSPTPGDGTPAEAPLIPATYTLDRKADRNLYHNGRRYDLELGYLTDDLAWIIERSEQRVTGVGIPPLRPNHRQPRCPKCDQPLAQAWRWCPFCNHTLDHATGPAA